MSTGNIDGNEITYFNFNQDCSSLLVGTKNGFRIFGLQQLDGNGDGLECIYDYHGEEIVLIERLFSSSLIGIVSISAPRTLKVCHFKKKTEICSYSYGNTILAVKINRARLVVCLEETLYIHNIRDMKVLHMISDTPPNPNGLCSLTSSSTECYLAYPGSSQTGEVQIFDANNLNAKIMIPAHDSPLQAMAFNDSGTKIATASEKGTVVRVFSVADGTRLHEFRRGVKRFVSISSLTFSSTPAGSKNANAKDLSSQQYLCCASNTETVHVFKLEEPKEEVRQAVEGTESWRDYLTKAVYSVSASYLPTQVADVFNQARDFAVAHLPDGGINTGIKHIAGITTVDRVLRLLVASSNGLLYVYNMDSPEGGDLTLVKTHKLENTNSQTDVITNYNTHYSSTPDGLDKRGSQAILFADAIDQGVNCQNYMAPNQVNQLESGIGVASYASIVKGNSPNVMSGTDSDLRHELIQAAETPDKTVLDDIIEFPPVLSTKKRRNRQQQLANTIVPAKV